MTKRLKDNLLARARAWAGQMTRLSKAYAPNHVEPSISSSVEAKIDGTYIIRTIADRKIAPDARAQEYGSGIHSRRGKKAEYPIRPKTTFGSLAFYENAAGTWDYEMIDPPMPREYTTDGRGLFYGVWHPGIQAANGGKGYIALAKRELKKKAKKELQDDIRAAIMADIRESFGRK